jgi:hypothetical protein
MGLRGIPAPTVGADFGPSTSPRPNPGGSLKNHVPARLAMGVLLCSTAIGCGDRTGSSRVGVIDLGGVATFTERARIDGHAHGLVPVGGLTVGVDGIVAFLQSQESAVRFFSSAGEPLGTYAGRGNGPGEFLRMARLGWVGDTLWVHDPGQGRITLIGPDRAHVRDERLPTSASPGPEVEDVPPFLAVIPLARESDGSMLALLEVPAVDPVPEPYTDHVPVGRIDRGGEIQRILALLPLRGVQLLTPIAQMGVPFPNGPQFSVSPDGHRFALAIATLEGPDAGTFSLTVVDARGEPVHSGRVPFEGEPIPRAVADSVFGFWEDFVRGQVPELATEFRQQVTIPPVHPPLTGLVTGRDGTVWVRLRDTEEGSRYRVFGADGEFLGELGPVNGRIAAVGEDGVWVVEPDDLGVESVVRYEVEWTGR